MSQTSSPVFPFDADLRTALVAMVRRRVPESEVEDIVQAALAEAIESPHAPPDSESLRRWIFGVAKHKVVDYHRRQGRLSYELPELSESPAPHVEADMLRWAEKHLPEGEDAKKTLDWMLREGEGEKLETIAETEHVPAPRVRQRVSRLRRHFKDHWQKEVAILAALGVLITAALAFYLRQRDVREPIAEDPKAVPIDPRAEPLRKDALERCTAADYKKCIEELDEAKRLDPAGDARPDVQEARKNAVEKSITPPPAPSGSMDTKAPVPTFAPSKSDSWGDSTSPPAMPKKPGPTKSAKPAYPSKTQGKTSTPSVGTDSERGFTAPVSSAPAAPSK